MQDVDDAVARLLPVPEITAAELARRIDTGERIVLFDVREAAEYAQSRIPGALRVPPEASAAAVLAEHGARMAGNTVVLYCAVGWRSGLLLQGIRQAAGAAPAAALLNLRGGIFRWHAERPHWNSPPTRRACAISMPTWGQLLRRLIGS